MATGKKKKLLKDVAVSFVSGLTLCFQNHMCARGTVSFSSPLARGQGTSRLVNTLVLKDGPLWQEGEKTVRSVAQVTLVDETITSQDRF